MLLRTTINRQPTLINPPLRPVFPLRIRQKDFFGVVLFFDVTFSLVEKF